MALRTSLVGVLAGVGVTSVALAVDIPDRPVASSAAGSAPAAAGNATRDTLVDLLLQVEQLQTEVRTLRGRIETQDHEIERLKTRQRDTAADFDRRLRDAERKGAVTERPAEAGATEDVAVGASAPEQLAYDSAFGLLKQGNYEKAAKAFREFLVKYPRSPLAESAQYWVGEALYVGRNFRLARDEFAKVVADYPGGSKASDAALKVGYCFYETGEFAKAREALTQVVSKYPGTRPAKLAEERLAKMKKEKR